MKRFLLGLFVAIFAVVFMSPIYNVSFAQRGSNNTEGGEQRQNGGGGGTDDIGINLSGSCMEGMGKGCFDYEKMIGISKMQNQKYTAKSIVQDVILSATYMVGAVLTLVIIYCGLMYIFSARGGKDTSTYRRGLVNAAIGALLVWGAYAIVRLIQYIAKG